MVLFMSSRSCGQFFVHINLDAQAKIYTWVCEMSGLTTYSCLRRINEACFKRHPLLTNVTLSCCLAGTSDYIAQKFLQGHKTLDTERMRHMVTYSCTTAPLWHLWYKLVDQCIKPSRTWFKVILDQTTVTPLDYIGFFAVFNYVKGDTIEECKRELKRVYFKALIPDTMFWPFVTFMGYKWIPLQYRFVYFEFLGLVWDTFLSYLKYSGGDKVNSTDISSMQKPLLAGNGQVEMNSNYKISQTTNRCSEWMPTNSGVWQNFGEIDLTCLIK